MGAYIYRLAAPDRQAVAQLGERRVCLGQIEYAYKPTQAGDPARNRERHRQYVTVPGEAWANLATPEYVAVTDDAGAWLDDTPVLRWPKGRKSVSDDPNYGGLIVGALRLTGDPDVPLRIEVRPRGA